MVQANADVREKVKFSGLKFWQVADRYGLTDGNFSKKLRKELPENEKHKIFLIIEDLISEQGGL